MNKAAIDSNNGATSSAGNLPVSGTPANHRTCLLVLGMHRSGTSALTRVLSFLGAALPKQMIAANPSNPRGHWEPEPIAEFNENLLAELGNGWNDFSPLDLDQLSATRRKKLVRKLAKIITSEYDHAPLFVFKEPRICRLAPLVLEALELLKIKPLCVLPYRNPLEVSESLAAREALWSQNFLRQDAILIWLEHVLSAEQASRGIPRVFLAYDNLLNDWRTTIRPLVDMIASQRNADHKTLLDQAAPEIDEFLSPALRHHQYYIEALHQHPETQNWAARTYDAYKKLTSNPTKKSALTTLDEVHTQFHAAAPFLRAYHLSAHQKISQQRQELTRITDEAHEAGQHANIEQDRTEKDLRDQIEQLETSLANWHENHIEQTERITQLENLNAQLEDHVSALRNSKSFKLGQAFMKPAKSIVKTIRGGNRIAAQTVDDRDT